MVADFGSARMVPREGTNVPVHPKGRTRNLTETTKLLDQSYITSRVGNPKWAAPEVLSRSAYGTPADVYRYTENLTDKQTHTSTDKQIVLFIVKRYYNQTDRQTNSQSDGQTDGRVGGRAVRQTDR